MMCLQSMEISIQVALQTITYFVLKSIKNGFKRRPFSDLKFGDILFDLRNRKWFEFYQKHHRSC